MLYSVYYIDMVKFHFGKLETPKTKTFKHDSRRTQLKRVSL